MSGPTVLPPGPDLPAAVQTLAWFSGAQAMMRRCAGRYGESFTLRILHEGTWVMLSNPDHVRQVFSGDPAVFHAGEGNQILLPILGPNSVLLLDGREHLAQRRLLLPPFHGERMRAYEGLMRECAAEEIDRWPAGVPYRLRPRMQAITLEIILRAVFGLSEGEQIDRLRNDLRRLLDVLTDPKMMVFPMVMGVERLRHFGPFRRLLRAVDEGVYAVIASRRAEGRLDERADILSLLLQAGHEDGSPMSDQEVRDELLTLLVAGHETTANALAWAVERLVRSPAQLDRLRTELHADERTYLDAVVLETLRLRPVISLVARRLQAPVEIGPWRLPAGVTVTPSIYLMHRRPEIYPDPEAFRPERFLTSPPGTYTWIPFGGGVRRCLGAAFAQVEMAIVLAEVLRRWDVRPTSDADEPVLRRAITETPRHDTEVVLSAVGK